MSFFTLRRQMDDLMNQMMQPQIYDPFYDVGMSDVPLLTTGIGAPLLTSGLGSQFQQGIGGDQMQTESGGGVGVGGGASTSSTALSTPTTQTQMQTFGPQLIRADVHEEKDKYAISAEIPGVAKENVRVTVENNYLTISGEKKEEKQEEKEQLGRRIRRSERRFGQFSRSFRLPTTCDVDKVQATFNNGVLNINVPKTEQAQAQQKQINIQ